jgi:uncharacterized membrane-anchored protein YhcB (DUF1043 family)
MDMWTVSLVTNVVGIISGLVLLPGIIFSFIAYRSKLKLQNRQIDLEEKRIQLEDRKLSLIENENIGKILDNLDDTLTR